MVEAGQDSKNPQTRAQYDIRIRLFNFEIQCVLVMKVLYDRGYGGF